MTHPIDSLLAHRPPPIGLGTECKQPPLPSQEKDIELPFIVPREEMELISSTTFSFYLEH